MALLRAGLAETIERGGRMPSIESLCARAGYTRGAFYLYFRHREHYIADLFDWVLTDILKVLFVGATQDAVDFEEVVDRFFAALGTGEWPDLDDNIRAGYMGVLLELDRAESVRERHTQLMVGTIDRMAKLIVDGQKQGSIRRDIDAATTASFLMLAAVGAILWDGVGIRIDHAALAATTRQLLSPT